MRPSTPAHNGADYSHQIRRRDFLNGILLAAGSTAMGSFSSLQALAHSDIGRGMCDGVIGRDPRVQRGGNLASVFNVGHWLRDERLTFTANAVRLAPAACDRQQGHFDLVSDNGHYDVIIVGSGLSGLSAAFYLTRRQPGTRILILDGNPSFGGNAGRDDAAPLPVIAATAGAYAVDPYADFLFEIYTGAGIDWAAHYIPDPVYSYFFDDRTPYALPGTHRWALDVYGAGVQDLPYPAEILHDLQRARQDFRHWYNRDGAPTDPADDSHPRFDFLASLTLHEYLTQRQHFHPAVADFYTRFAVDALAGTSEQVSAYTAISFLGAEYHPLFAFPGGNSGIARHFLQALIPDAIQGTTTEEILHHPLNPRRLDNPHHTVRLRQGAMVLRAHTTQHHAEVVYYHDGQFYRAAARAVILAGQAHTAHRLVEHLLDTTTLQAWAQFSLVPVIIANVTLRRAAPLVGLGLGYNQYYWGSRYWADFVIADWVTPQRFDRERQTVLTFYGANTFPPEEMPQERMKLLQTPFQDYEQSLREDLHRVLASTDFDFDRDVSAIYLYRWGHGMIFPKPGFAFGPPQRRGERTIRTLAARHTARQHIGRLSFAGQDTESSPAVESAIASGLRTALESLERL